MRATQTATAVDAFTASIGLGLPMFICGLSDAIKAKSAHWGKENMAPGDILLTNDGYVMGSHLSHMIFTLPIVHDGEIVAFFASMAYWLDVGGVLGGVTRDIYEADQDTLKLYTTSPVRACYLIAVGNDVSFPDDPYSEYLV